MDKIEVDARAADDRSAGRHDFSGLHLVNPAVFEQAGTYHAAFEHAEPFRHVLIDNFFRPSVAERMLSEFPVVKDPSTLRNEFGDPGQKSQISAVRELGGVYTEVDTYIQGPEFLNLMEKITGIPNLRYDPYYFGAGTHENLHGAGLDAHYDFNIHPKTRQHRRLNAIIYLNKNWDPDWKGSIALHSDPWDLHDDKKKEIPPIFNRCVIFETNEHSWHSVVPVDLPEDKRHLSRKSFTIYLYSDTRPSEEAAPEHGTIYVQAPLSKHIKAGHTLDENDIKEIESNIARRHYMLRNLYKREYKFAAIIDEMKAHIGELQAHSYVPLLGYGKLVRVAEPLFPDGWMGTRLSCLVQPVRPVTGVRLSGWSAEGAPKDLELTLRCGRTTARQVVPEGLFDIDLQLPSPVSEPVEISVEASRVRRAGGSDERDISVIVNAIELLHG